MGPDCVEVVDSLGPWVFDFRRASLVAYTQELALAEPVALSVLSGEPGYRYRTAEVDLVLTREELFLLMRHDLLPRQVQKLLEVYGAFSEIRQDFYDERIFLALKPMKAYPDM